MQNESAPSPQQLHHWVADRLRTAIHEGQLKPGEWLRQERLAQEYGVSQMPVREALKQLIAEGLIEHVPYKGARVVEFSTDDIEDLYENRAALEGMAARSAAKNITAEELADLKEISAAMKQRLGPQFISEYRDLNRRFHMIVTAASRRAYLTRTINQMWASFPTMLLSNFARTVAAPIPDRGANDVEEHEALIAALERHDSELAEQLVRQHIQETGSQLVQALRSQ